jgi:hypothetical protein
MLGLCNHSLERVGLLAQKTNLGLCFIGGCFQLGRLMDGLGLTDTFLFALMRIFDLLQLSYRGGY